MSRIVALFLTVSFVSSAYCAQKFELDDGKYRLVVVVEKCDPSPTGYCAILSKGSDSQRIYHLGNSEWDESLRSLAEIPVQIWGRLENDIFTPYRTPRVFVTSADMFLFDDREHIEYIGKLK